MTWGCRCDESNKFLKKKSVLIWIKRAVTIITRPNLYSKIRWINAKRLETSLMKSLLVSRTFLCAAISLSTLVIPFLCQYFMSIFAVTTNTHLAFKTAAEKQLRLQWTLVEKVKFIKMQKTLYCQQPEPLKAFNWNFIKALIFFLTAAAGTFY